MIGELLRKKREELGLALEEVSRTTRIKYDYLKAIEDEAFERLPVEVYVKGYIREYAKILNIEPEAALDVYVQQMSPPEKEEIPQIEISQEKRPKRRYLFIPLLLVAVTSVFIIFYLFTPEVPKKPPLPSEYKKEEVLQVKDTRHILEAIAVDTTWLSITTDGQNVREVLLQPGESVKWDAQRSFSLIIGNAGGIKLIFDGKEIGPLGAKGQVIRLNLPSSETIK